MAESFTSESENAKQKSAEILSDEERLAQTLARAMASVVSSFNRSTSSRTTYEDFLKVLAREH